MMGLLDQATDDPNTAGLLSMGLRLMSTPGRFGQAFGQSGLGAMDDVQKLKMQLQERKNAQQRAEFMQMQMDQQKRQQAAQEQQAARLEAWRKGLTPPQGAAVNLPGMPARNATQADAAMGTPGYGISSATDRQVSMPPTARQQGAYELAKAGEMGPAEWFKFNNPEPVKLGKDESLLDPTQGYKSLAANVTPEKAPDLVREYVYAGGDAKFGPNGFTKWAHDMKAAGSTKLSIDQRQPGAFNTAQGTEFSGMMGGINKASFAAPAQLRKLERLESLLTGVDGGKFSPAGLEVASAANSFGVKIDPRLGNKQAAQALAIDMANSMRVPGTGVMTDKDFDNFLRQIPDLSKSAEGRAQITATMRAALKRDIEVGNLARAYVKRHGQLDNGFLDEAAQFMAANPVVSGPSAAAGEDDLVNRYRTR